MAVDPHPSRFEEGGRRGRDGAAAQSERLDERLTQKFIMILPMTTVKRHIRFRMYSCIQ